MLQAYVTSGGHHLIFHLHLSCTQTRFWVFFALFSSASDGELLGYAGVNTGGSTGSFKGLEFSV